MPAVDRATGKVLLASKDQVALSPRRPRRHAGRPGRPGPGWLAELPGRDARAGRADALLLPGGQSAGPDRRPVVHRPAPRGRRRDVVQGRRAALARREAGRGRDRRRPSPGDRVFRPARPSWPAAACPRGRSSSGPAASPFTSWSGRSSSGWSASIGCRSIARSRRSPTSTRAGRSIKPAEPNAREVRAVHLRRAAAGQSAGRWSRPTGPASSSRSRTPSAPTRRRPSTSG